MAKVPIVGEYDYSLGIEPDILDYIVESHEVQSRISSTPCYLFCQNTSGSVVGSSILPILVTSYTETTPNYRTVIYSSGSVIPDLRPDINDGRGAVTVLFDSVEGTRVLDVEDLVDDNEFVVEKRDDVDPMRIELVFNSGYNPSSHEISYYYSTINKDICDLRIQRGDDSQQSLFGWSQYISEDSDAFRLKNQILVRFPLTLNDLTINEEGKVIMEENQCWMTASPFVRDMDILVIAAEDSPIGEELRFEIQDKQNSVIQRRLVSQRFKVKLLEKSDKRYQLNVSKV